MDAAALLRSTDVSEEAVELLRQWLEERAAAHVIGNGVLRQAGAEKPPRHHGVGGHSRGFWRGRRRHLYKAGTREHFHNPQFMDGFPVKGRILQAGRPEEIVPEPSLDMLWISGANPLTQSLHQADMGNPFAGSRVYGCCGPLFDADGQMGQSRFAGHDFLRRNRHCCQRFSSRARF